jgi:hypothetical protein
MTTSIDAGRSRRLRLYNLGMGLLHAAQGVAVVVLSNDFSLPVTAAFLDGQPGVAESYTGLEELFSINLGYGVAAFLFMSAIAHFVIASPGVFGWYVSNLGRHRNYARWVEYSLSSSVMVVLIAMLTGLSDASALIAIFGVNAAMILFGWLVERDHEPGEAGWGLPFTFGSIAGIFPWIAIGLYLWSPTTEASPPGFVYGIFVSLFVFFNSFAVNQVLQYRRVGRWRDYVYGEFAYVTLSLVAKSLLAWQVFAGALAA